MLCKTVCKACCKLRWPKIAPEMAQPYWDDSDEYDWKEGFIICPIVGVKESAIVSEKPPSWCPYAFEHAVAESGVIDIK